MSLTLEPDGTLTKPVGTTGAVCCSSRSRPRPRPRPRRRSPGPPPRRDAPASMMTRRFLPAAGPPPERRRTALPAVAVYAFSIASSSTLTSPSTTSMPAFLRWASTSSTLVFLWVAMSETLRFAIHLTAFRLPAQRERFTHAGIESGRAAEGARERALLLRGLEALFFWTQVRAPTRSAWSRCDHATLLEHEPYQLVLAAPAATADARSLRRRHGDHSSPASPAAVSAGASAAAGASALGSGGT